MTTRTYTYTLADYMEILADHGRSGHVGIDPDGDLIWSRGADIVWAYDTIVLDWPKAMQYRAEMQPSEIIYTPSPMQKEEFDAR